MLSTQIQTELLERALAEPIGLVVECINPRQFAIQLHASSKDFPELMLCTPAEDNTIFIMKRSVELD